MKYKLYWIYKQEHEDPYTEGYIGVTAQEVNIRVDQHIREKSFIDKNCKYTILLESNSLKEIFNRELSFRPTKYIGWNIDKGGKGSCRRVHKYRFPIQMNLFKYETNLLRGNSRTKKQKESSKRHSIRMKGRIAHNKGKTGNIGKNNGMSKEVYIDDTLYETHTIAKKELAGIRGIATLGNLVKKYGTNQFLVKNKRLCPYNVEVSKIKNNTKPIMTPEGSFSSMKDYCQFRNISDQTLRNWMKKLPKEYYRI
tara:strand:+ start:722 stop:1480 length:759 start_codon:yes stop_codon:yes gene_type:complete